MDRYLSAREMNKIGHARKGERERMSSGSLCETKVFYPFDWMWPSESEDVGWMNDHRMFTQKERHLSTTAEEIKINLKHLDLKNSSTYCHKRNECRTAIPKIFILCTYLRQRWNNAWHHTRTCDVYVGTNRIHGGCRGKAKPFCFVILECEQSIELFKYLFAQLRKRIVIVCYHQNESRCCLLWQIYLKLHTARGPVTSHERPHGEWFKTLDCYNCTVFTQKDRHTVNNMVNNFCPTSFLDNTPMKERSSSGASLVVWPRWTQLLTLEHASRRRCWWAAFAAFLQTCLLSSRGFGGFCGYHGLSKSILGWLHGKSNRCFVEAKKLQ